ncbi:Tda9p NDAI_0D03240 [Naumovozyma dairenensis CBS 421]|uniref:C2H2-type domain-containing protein n=1 Tax=Naumovozyma dairenensis (strain ATCC 10597 / BCRC 20456 / CBS 421 / NBRC 0211 / NRRL Y-12639) TaxID=1071378 RepID=G0WA27_NAUDC|nr:hypothetical protein NDAI_0D03240 [Naumovozyma dairenensis CBS 421]CCD24638.1 hypothetical protein NDAI_0D03240 [Naumovozyma dairenensis CBS 421]
MSPIDDKQKKTVLSITGKEEQDREQEQITSGTDTASMTGSGDSSQTATPTPGLIPIPKKSRRIKTNKPRPFVCSTCTRGFVRQEHLKRHQRSHTNEKPFLCVFCGRCFARRDLVLRHQHKLHAALIGTSMDSYTNSSNNNGIPVPFQGPLPDSAEDKINKNIIQIKGNKATILPTPRNPLAKTAAQLKREARETEARNKHEYRRTSNEWHPDVTSTTSSLKSTPSPATYIPSGSVGPPPVHFEEQQQQQQQPIDYYSHPLRQEHKIGREPSPALLQDGTSRSKRHASFSASSAFTYAPDNPTEKNTRNISNNNNGSGSESMNDVPHQVGFSTPQLTAQQLIDKALESGVDFEALELPPFFSLDDPNSYGDSKFNINDIQFSLSNDASNIPGNTNNIQPNNQPSVLHVNSSVYNISTGVQSQMNISSRGPPPMTPNNGDIYGFAPYLSDFLTMSSSFGGSGGFSKSNSVNSNLAYFNYQNIPYQPEHDVHQFSIPESNLPQMVHDNTTARYPQHPEIGRPASEQPTKQASSQEVYYMSQSHEFDRPKTAQGALEISNGTSLLKSNLTNNPDYQQHLSTKMVEISNIHPDEHWLTDFIAHPLDMDFKTSGDHFNEIGFLDNAIGQAPTPPSVDPKPLSNVLPKLIETKDNLRDIHTNQGEKIALAVNTHPNLNTQNNHASSATGHKLDDVKKLTYNVSSLFNSRQFDLFQKSVASSKNLKDISNGSNAKYTRNKNLKICFFTEELRNSIINDNKSLANFFPTVDELNDYVQLYQREFHYYFPILHLYSVEPSMENYPLLLSIAMCGAIYGFHSIHAKILSNISWIHVREYLEQKNNCYETTPLWIIQSLILLTFIGIFSNDVNVIKNMKPQLMTLIQLVKITKLNLPLENFVKPPIESDHVMEFQDNPSKLAKIKGQYKTEEQIEKNFNYFILAQSRIRTCHVVLLLSNFFSSVSGRDCCFHSLDLKCGIPCYHEVLYLAEDSEIWSFYLNKFNIELDSKFSLIELSNGDGSYENCLMYLSNGSQFLYENTKISFKTLLSLLISIHEKIFIERNVIKQNLYNDPHISNSSHASIQLNDIKWRMTSRPIVASMLKYWEALYIKNGGILVPNKDNIPMIRSNPSMRLIIPLHLFAKIRKCIDLSTILELIWLQEWNLMNENLKSFLYDWESLHEATTYSVSIIGFWIDTISITENSQNIKTPILSVTCIFTSILILSEYLKLIENWASDVINNRKDVDSTSLKIPDRTLWLKAFKLMKKIERQLLSKGANFQGYAEFLNLPEGSKLLDDNFVENVMRIESPIHDTIKFLKTMKMSIRCLYMGVRILGDSPVWPISLTFANALQSRALYILKEGDTEQRIQPDNVQN